MSDPEETVWPRDGHTEAKHRLLRGYLDAWLPIMGTTNQRIVLVDGFAGPGEYSGGEPGSPRIMLDALLSHTARDRITAEVVFLFVEQRADRVRHLRAKVDELTLPDNVQVIVEHGLFEDRFGEVLDEVEAGGRQLAPTFAFIDPFGYSKAKMSLSSRFLRFRGCEVLIYVPIPFVSRFLGRADQDAAMNGLFGSEAWRAGIPLKGQARRAFIHDLFRDQLCNVGGTLHVRSFEIITAGSRGYHLFFGSNHALGLRKMKEVMWATDPAQGQSYRDSTNSHQPVLFETTVDTGPLLASLRERFGTAAFTIDDAERHALLETPYLPSHVRRTLKPEEQAARLDFVSGKSGRRRFTYPAGTTVRFAG